MATIKVYDQEKQEVGSVELAPEVFEVEARPEILNLVVRAQLAAKRAGTHSAKTRAYVSGGGVKPWKQKGTGRARAGSNRSPVWRGGAIIFGPQPRDYSFKVNRKVRANLDKAKAEEDAKQYRDQYTELSQAIEDVRKQKAGLLDSADLPLPGLSVKDGELIYNGQQWDNMSSAEQMIVSTSIVRKLNPKCGFDLLDKLEAMDLDTLKEFGAWLEQEGLQAIATRVSTGDECSIVITDGYVEGQDGVFAKEEEKPAPVVTGWSGTGF